MNIFIFGLGYSARQSGKALREFAGADVKIAGTTRSGDKARELMRDGFKVHAFDGRAQGFMLGNDLKNATHIIISVPPQSGEDVVLQHHKELLAEATNLQWLCYYSSLAVYGDAEGAWIDEDSGPEATSKRGQERLVVERQWQELADQLKVPLSIFRIAGIYGPGRSALDKLREGTAKRIIKPGQVFNRIHVEDLARLTALAARQNLAGTFNVTDDEPSPPQDVVTYASEVSGRKAPDPIAFEDAEMSEFGKSFYADCKRVSNAAIKKALGVELRYPSYRSGLNSIFDIEARGD